MNRIESAAHCILVACDRSLARSGPLLNNLQAQDRLRSLGFEIARGRRILGDARRGGYEAVYVHPDCGFAIAYVVEELADAAIWRLERRPLPPRRPSVYRYDYRLGIHAPEVSDADALSLVPEGDDAFIVRFYSERFLKDRRLPAVEGFYGDPVSPDVEPYAVCAAYRTNNWGEVRGQAYVIACRFTGRRDAEGRRIFADSHGEFVLGGESGSPECPARFWLCEPAC